jgi:hypothetical protein
MDRVDGRKCVALPGRVAWQMGLVLLVALAAAGLTGVRSSGAADEKDAPPDPAARAREAALRRRSVNKLKQLALAMHNYHSVNGSFPAAAVFDKDGKPLLSWRVLLLPYLEEQKLYNDFHLDEPWDSAHNKKLLERMPKTYQLDIPGQKPNETVYVGLAGKGTVFDGKKGVKITDITDGTSNTVMFVESARGVPWSKPEDLPYDPAKPLPKLGLISSGGSAAFCDGSVRFIATGTPEATIRALITRNGGEVPGAF